MKEKKKKYVEVAPAIPLRPGESQTFTYQLKAGFMLSRYARVTVPVGARIVPGIVMDVHRRRPHYNTKTIQRVLQTRLTSHQVMFAKWIADAMQGGLGYTLRLFVPPVLTVDKAALGVVPTTHTSSSPPLALVRKLQLASPAALIDKNCQQRALTIRRVAHWYSSRGQQTLILLPELWMLDSYKHIFRDDIDCGAAAVLHAGLRKSVQARIWHQVTSGAISTVIGTQKALFLPYRDLGIVILEEEQFDTHKLWDQYPRLHNAYAARELARIHDASLLYASSFPSVSLQQEIIGSTVVVLKNNPVNIRTSIIGSSFEDRRHRRPVPHEFVTRLRMWLKSKERILILHNQRQSFVEKVLKELKLYRKTQLVFGTTGVFSKVRGGQFDRVVWLFPERSLRYPDYRSHERSMVLLARLKQHVKGTRAVTLVTRYPQLVREQLAIDSEKFYSLQLKERQKYCYPPFSDMVRLTVVDKTTPAAMKRAGAIRGELDKRKKKVEKRKVIIRGPYQGFGKSRNGRVEAYIVLLGSLEILSGLYKGLDVDSADVAPHRVL